MSRTQDRFVPSAGRWRHAEKVRFLAKRYFPGTVVRLASAALAPLRLARRLADRSMRRHRVLPRGMRSAYAHAWREAHRRWFAGLTHPTSAPITLPISRSGPTITLRPGTSDILLYEEIIVQERYGRGNLTDVRVIIDCGANIGLTTAYLLNRYPHARALALEPDPLNVELCRRNLLSFGTRATVLHAGVWGTTAQLALADADRMGTWASQVVPVAAPQEGDTSLVPAYDVPTLFSMFQEQQIDLLKIDVEGAEFEIFNQRDLSWLDRVRCIQIELESPESEALFLRVVGGRFSLSRSGDVTIAIRQ